MRHEARGEDEVQVGITQHLVGDMRAVRRLCVARLWNHGAILRLPSMARDDQGVRRSRDRQRWGCSLPPPQARPGRVHKCGHDQREPDPGPQHVAGHEAARECADPLQDPDETDEPGDRRDDKTGSVAPR